MELSNHGLTFAAPGLQIGSVLRAVKLLRGRDTIVGNITLVVQTRLRGQVGAAIRGATALNPYLIQGAEQCAELLLRAARTRTLRLQSLTGGSVPVECLAVGLEPHSMHLTIRAKDGTIFGLGEVVEGTFVLDRRSYRFSSEVVRSAPLALRCPSTVERAWESEEPRWLASNGGGATAVLASPLSSTRDSHELHALGLDDLSFDFDREQELFPLGLLLPQIVINLRGQILTVVGEVSAVRAVSRSLMRCNVQIATSASQRAVLGHWLASQAAGRSAATGPDGVSVERLEDPARIRALLNVLARSKVSVCVKDGGEEGEGISVPSLTLDGDSIRWPFPLRSSATASMTCHNSAYCFRIDQLSSDGLCSSLPLSILHVRQRWFRRVPLSPAEAPRFGRWPLCDLSHDGFSFQFDPASESYVEGAVMRRACIKAHDSTVCFDLEICAVELRHKSAICRVRAVPCTAQDKSTWETIVESRLHPDTKIGPQWAEALWTLYQSSGYFSLSGKEPSTFDALKPGFLRVFGKLDRAAHLGCHVAFPSKAIGAAGGLSALKVYSRSWLGFQMAKIKGDTAEGIPGRTVLREIHRAIYERIQLDPELGWLIAYPQVKPVWSRLAHHDLPRRFVDSGEACIVRFQAVEIAARASLPNDEITEANEEEIALLLLELSRTRPQAYLEALDLTPQQHDLRANKSAWQAAGLARERTVLVSRRHGKAIAAAVIESAEDGTHLFRLLDLVRLFPLARGAEEEYPRLLSEAGRWFACHGKQRFVLFREVGTEVDLSSCEVVQDMGLADMSILSAARIPELLEYIHEITAPSPRSSSESANAFATPSRDQPRILPDTR